MKNVDRRFKSLIASRTSPLPAVRPEFILAQQVRKFLSILLMLTFIRTLKIIIKMIFDLQNISEAICNLISELTNMGIALHNIRGIEVLPIIISISKKLYIRNVINVNKLFLYLSKDLRMI